jgi:hypothetical protein
MSEDAWLKELRRLSARVARIERAVLGEARVLEAALAERGLKVYAKDPTDRLLLPEGASPDVQERFYARMHRYSFRLLLREAIKLGRFGTGDLTRYCSPQAAALHLRFLVWAGVAEAENDAFRLTRPVSSLGPTLEWYVARLFEREFLAPAIYGVRLRGTRSGGDYDVIAMIEGELAYAEVKSSPPKGIELPEVRAFLRRLSELAPALSFFIVDTELRMKDKIVPLFEEAAPGSSPVRLHAELFRASPAVYIINSRKGIATNIRRCVLAARRGL